MKSSQSLPEASLGAAMGHSIGAVERDTGLSKDTLRIWERRYQFPQPARDASGERVYPLDQVNKLRLLKRLIDSGHRPGKIIQLEIAQLRMLGDGLTPLQPRAGEAAADVGEMKVYIELCKQQQGEDLRLALSQRLLRLGLQTFVTELIGPLTHLVGEQWARGRLAIHEEHLYTEVVQNILRNAIAAVVQGQPVSALRPRILLTTFPQEMHGIGLLMAEAILSLEGARCISLGVQTPIHEIVGAARTHQADIVALSFTGMMGANQVLEGLNDLRQVLPESLEIWVGGNNPLFTRRQPLDVARVLDLATSAEALRAWRARMAGH